MPELSHSVTRRRFENAESKPFTNLPLDPFLKGSHVNFQTGNVRNGPNQLLLLKLILNTNEDNSYYIYMEF